METMVVTEAHADAGDCGGRLHGAQLGGVERAGFFDEHVFARIDGGESDGASAPLRVAMMTAVTAGSARAGA